MTDKKTVAVVFGGRSVEHDVSILTGLQFLEALDPTLYKGLPVYIDPLGQWWTGPALYKRAYYPFDAADTAHGLEALQLDLSAVPIFGRPAFLKNRKSFLGSKSERLFFDILVPAIHGSNGEDGSLQGLLDFAAIPYTGTGRLGSSLTMDKYASKNMAGSKGIPVLDSLLLMRPQAGSFVDDQRLKSEIATKLSGTSFPYIVKPRQLGSSVGVNRAHDFDDIMSAALSAFKLDNALLIEPCIEPLIEYNIAVRRTADGQIETSAIERPLSKSELLDFKNKYLSGQKSGAKLAEQTGAKSAGGANSAGMASLSRELSPKNLSAAQEADIRRYAVQIFDIFELAGSIRIDFLCHGDTGEIWFNEVNAIPGSFAYFLWEAANHPLSFLTLTHQMIEEGLKRAQDLKASTDRLSAGAQIFHKHATIHQ